MIGESNRVTELGRQEHTDACNELQLRLVQRKQRQYAVEVVAESYYMITNKSYTLCVMI